MRADRVLTEFRRHLDSLDRPDRVQRDLLTEILRENGDTEYARRHDLAKVNSIDEYRRAVPIRTHEELMPWIERTIAGETGVLTADDPVVYFSSSGSTGREKHIPVTRTYMQRVFLPFYHASFAVLMQSMPQALASEGGVLNLWQDPTSPIGRTRGGQAHLGPSQVDYRRFGEDAAVLGSEAAWARIPDELRAANPWDRAYVKLRLAAEQDIRLLIGVNPAMVAGLSYQLRQEWPRLVEEIRAGTLGGRPHGAPNPERADEIAGYAKTFGTVHPYHLWPHLAGIVAWNSALASMYLPRVRETFGPGVQLFAAPIASCEGPAAVPVDRHPSAAPLFVSGCLYEFVPAEQELRADAETLLVSEVEPGRDYHLIFSHVGGLYRCAVTDVVRVTGRAGRTPRIEYAGRNVVRSGAGENLTEAAAVRALRAALADTGAELRNATFHLDSDRYRVAVAGIVTPGLAAALDTRLAEQSPGYRAARASGALSRLDVVVTHPDAFLREWERTIRAGQRPPRVKDRVFLPAEDAWLRITGDAA